MSHYVYGTSLSYRDYLQAKSFEDDLRADVAKHTRTLVSSAERLRESHISVTEHLDETVAQGFERVSFDLRGIDRSIEELNATLEWGFGELLPAVARINDSLDDLVRLAKTPAQTWAYEQFEIARDAFDKDLFAEAVEYLNRAINGGPGQTGYRIEYRFHFLLGTVRLGSFKNNSPTIVDLSAAEMAFADAGRYARRDFPVEAGRSFVAASWAAYCRGNMEAVCRYAEAAVALHPECGEGSFLLAKALFHLATPERALVHLRQAIKIDRNYAVRAACDGDCQRYQADVDRLLEALREEAGINALDAMSECERLLTAASELTVDDYKLAARADLKPAISLVRAGQNSSKEHSYFGYLDSSVAFHQATTLLKEHGKQFLSDLSDECEAKAEKVERRIAAAGNGTVAFGTFVAGLVLAFLLGVAGCNGVREGMRNERFATLKSNEARLIEAGALVVGRSYYDRELVAMGLYQGLPPNPRAFDGFGTWMQFFIIGAILSCLAAPASYKATQHWERRELQVELEAIRRTQEAIAKIKWPPRKMKGAQRLGRL